MRTYFTIGCVYIITGCVIAILAFYESYCARSPHLRKGFKWRHIAIQSVKIAGALLLLLVVFTVSQILCKHFQIGFWLSFTISVLISAAFLGAWHHFKIGPSDNSAADTDEKAIGNDRTV